MTDEINPAVVHRLCNALSCPIDCSEPKLGWACEQGIYELWYAFLCRYLPDTAYANSLLTFEGVLRCPTPDSLAYMLETDAQVEGVIEDIVRSRKDLSLLAHSAQNNTTDSHTGGESCDLPKPRCGVWIDEEFLRVAQWVNHFKVASKELRPKHWASSTTLSERDFLAESQKRMNEGLLLPNITPLDLKTTCLDGFIRLLEDTFDEEVGNNPRFRQTEYLDAWIGLVSKGAFRFSVWYEVPIGAYNGVWAKWMVCDMDVQGGIAHCYPTVTNTEISEEHQLQDESIGVLAETSGYFFGTMPKP